jgi:hypothetical protein
LHSTNPGIHGNPCKLHPTIDVQHWWAQEPSKFKGDYMCSNSGPDKCFPGDQYPVVLYPLLESKVHSTWTSFITSLAAAKILIESIGSIEMEKGLMYALCTHYF